MKSNKTYKLSPKGKEINNHSCSLVAMVDSKDIVLGVIGFSISFYGGKIEDQFLIVSGILIIILTMYLKVGKYEDDIEILKAQINTKSELNNIWREINEIKNTKFKKRK